MLSLTHLFGFGCSAGASGPPDFAPDALDIANINETGGTGFQALTNAVSVSGINQTISVRATISGVSGAASATLRQYRNGAQVDSVAVANGADTEVTYVAGNTLSFGVVTTGSSGASKSFTVTLTNQSDGGATLDTFTSFTQIDI